MGNFISKYILPVNDSGTAEPTPKDSAKNANGEKPAANKAQTKSDVTFAPGDIYEPDPKIYRENRKRLRALFEEVADNGLHTEKGQMAFEEARSILM